MTDEIITDVDGHRWKVTAEGWAPLDQEDASPSPNGSRTPSPSRDSAHLHTPPSEPPDLANEQRILDRLARELPVCGLVGEERTAALVYLGLTSRLLEDQVSLVLKGASSSGKSFTVQTVSRFLPPSAFIEITAMSERALVYSTEDFRHRTLIVYEAVALREAREIAESNLTAYFIRSLLSEGRIAYPVTVRDKDGNHVTKVIVKEGPTNLVLTTTATRLHGENETRMISLPTDDSAEQTGRVLRRLADEDEAPAVDFGPWHELQRWLEGAEHRVHIPYARWLADQIPRVAIRLRRDFAQLLSLIRTHAILHQSSRDRDTRGRIVASPEDYEIVRELVADLVAQGVESSVSPVMRQTVQAVAELADPPAAATVARLAPRLKLDRSVVQRRLQAARERGYIKNLEDRRGHPARYVLDEPLPEDVDLLPAQVHSLTP